jgi:hypothetical protein
MPTAAVLTSRHRAPRAAALVAALVVTAVMIGAPATAAPRPRPLDGSGDAPSVATPAVAVAASVLQSTRAALEALPNHADVHVDQILKNLAAGVMN